MQSKNCARPMAAWLRIKHDWLNILKHSSVESYIRINIHLTNQLKNQEYKLAILCKIIRYNYVATRNT